MTNPTEYARVLSDLRGHAEMMCPDDDKFHICGTIVTQEAAEVMKTIAEEYLKICDEECAGDRSVGVAPCRFFLEPDVGIEGGCQLKKAVEP